jgi:tRNA-uridine 2-sulfurtransferase
MTDKQVVALSLFSGGLDSILATRLVAEQGIKVYAIKFVSPFFNYDILTDKEKYIRETKEKYGIDVIVKDISEPYIKLLHKPRYGFGKNFNPCVDCKIFMFTQARQMMNEMGASFLITGEVLGQRPMSQRRDTLNVIERDSGNKTILLRPLSAKLMTETEVEKQGLIDREKLENFSGRGRSRQIALAKKYGITDFPAPAGGCSLADPILSKRFARMFAGDFAFPAKEINTVDILMLFAGRQFLLPRGGWLILGRNEVDNDSLVELKEEGDALLHMAEHPGPAALLRRAATIYEDDEKLHEDLQVSAELVVRYGKKIDGERPAQEVGVHYQGKKEVLVASPLEDKVFKAWMV